MTTEDSFHSCMAVTATKYRNVKFYCCLIILCMVIGGTLWNPLLFPGHVITSNFLSFSTTSTTSPYNNNNNEQQEQQQDLLPQELYRQEEPMTVEKMAQLRGPQGPKYNVLVTGAAGFIGMATALSLKELGMTPIGYDNVNSYYSTKLKELRISKLHQANIPLIRGDVCNRTQLQDTIEQYNITRVVHLAAQAGVRYSLDHPLEYTRNNIDCFVVLLETLKDMGKTGHPLMDLPLVYASSSSVYGNNRKVPFQETDRVEDPASLYATTKRSNEMTAVTYQNLYNLSSIGLRFFTVYGPYGRPDMAPWMFTDQISNNLTMKVFNHGKSQRDFTFVDDIVQGVVNSLLVNLNGGGQGRAEFVNLGNGRPIVLADFVKIVEQQVGHTTANKIHLGMQKGDVPVTFADITKARHLLAYHPTTPVEEGIAKFVDWFQTYQAEQYRMAT